MFLFLLSLFSTLVPPTTGGSNHLPLIPSLFKWFVQMAKALSFSLENQLQDLQDLGLDSSLTNILVCADCQEAISRCPRCKLLNGQGSLHELSELKFILNSMTKISNPEKPDTYYLYIDLNIPDREHLYRPELSNRLQALQTSKRLYNNLLKANKLTEFQDEINASIEKGHFIYLNEQQTHEILSKAHCFAALNFSIKESSNSQKIRPVLNNSFTHKSKDYSLKVHNIFNRYSQADLRISDSPPVHHCCLTFCFAFCILDCFTSL